ncbi:hypothetical protein BBJ28_00013755 [Nothophytophthora sp. Chile5]|nr:hypothetical protein BBJ28_00013755 [Nothophytophthora sp. Chile5]
MFFAVFAPLVVLVYFITHFQFDRAAFQTRVETLQYGSFDRTARLFGNPAQIASFCNAFHYLQFSDSGSLFTKSALNLLSLYKGKKVVLGLIGRHRARQLQPAQCQQPPLCTANSSLPVAPSGAVTEIRSIVKKYVGSKRRAAGFLSAFTFVLAGCGIFTYSLVAVHSSEELCRLYTQCAVVSYQWNVGATHCTCLVFVDRDIAPATYAEWVSPDDTTANLAELAVAGELRIIQIINRAVPVLPQELRRCHKLEQFILVYSKIVRLPDWIKEFNKLQYLHLEGDFTDQQIEYMPPDMFANMPDLAFMHLGCIPKVPLIPSLAKLRALRYLTMAVLHSLSSLPDLDGLTSLQTLNIVEATHIPRLPSFAALSKLKSMTLIDRNQVCCDGYITGQCDLTDFQCIPRVGEPVITCSSERLATSELEHLTAIGATLCQSNQTTDLKDMAPTQISTDELCGGVLYKQCKLNGRAGICFNSRMQVISCVVQAGAINMRKLQIARGLVFQTVTLITYLRSGFPTAIIYCYSVLQLCNWLVTCYRYQRYVADPNLFIARLYYTFDLFFAVFAPLVVLIYFIYTFQFDREAFLTKTETIGGGSYDTIARLFGDPTEISSFCSAFHYLQFSSGESLFYKSALNLLSLYKWRKIIVTLIRNHHERRLAREHKALVRPITGNVTPTATRKNSLSAALVKKIQESARKLKFGKYFVPKFLLPLIFLVAGITIFTYSIGAVSSSTALCRKYDKCVVTSYQWNFGYDHCTCLVFADRQLAPRTYAEWTDPVDAAAMLGELAVAGELRIVQIINRAVSEMPEQLRHCHKLQQLILIYTKTLRLPEWISEFSHLEYL